MTQDEYGDAAPCPPYYAAPVKKPVLNRWAEGAKITEDGVMTIGKTEVSSFILDEYEDTEKSEEEGMKKPVHPMDTQVSGDHYKTKGVQPLEATYQNYGIAGLEAAVFTKVNKYFRDKAGLEKKLDDCKKAQHVLQIFQEKLEAEIAKEKFEESYNRNR